MGGLAEVGEKIAHGVRVHELLDVGLIQPDLLGQPDQLTARILAIVAIVRELSVGPDS